MTGIRGDAAPSPRPGWYADPYGQSALRWWDGRRWTENARPFPQPEGRLPGNIQSLGSAAPRASTPGNARQPRAGNSPRRWAGVALGSVAAGGFALIAGWVIGHWHYMRLPVGWATPSKWVHLCQLAHELAPSAGNTPACARAQTLVSLVDFLLLIGFALIIFGIVCWIVSRRLARPAEAEHRSSSADAPLPPSISNPGGDPPVSVTTPPY